MTQERLLEAGSHPEPASIAPRLGADDEHQRLMTEAGKILTRRAHSAHEMRTKLSGDAHVVEAVVGRLIELRLVDDAAFARTWIEERSDRRGRDVLILELAAKGVAREVAQQAWDEVGPDELARAAEIAARHLRKVSRKSLAQQASAIHALLLRRGFSSEIAEQAAKHLLPPEGWD